METASISDAPVHHRVLVVDDDPIVLSGLAFDLEEEGFAVTTAASGEEALKTLSRQHVDLVLTDVVMHEMNGFDLLKSVRCNRPDLPVILLTGNGTIDAAVEGMRYGAVDYIQKPAAADFLGSKIRGVLKTLVLRRKVEEEKERGHLADREFTQGLLRSDRATGMALLAEECAGALGALLGPIQNHGRAIREGLGEQSHLRQYMREIERAGESLSTMLDELHLLMGQWESTSGLVDVRNIVRTCFDSAEFKFMSQRYPQVRLLTRLPREPAMIMGYGARLQLMLYHTANLLLSRADEGTTIEVRVSERLVSIPKAHPGRAPAGPEVCIRIEAPGDSGMAHVCRELWERCYQSRRSLARFMEEWSASVMSRVIQEHVGYVELVKDAGSVAGIAICFPASSMQHADRASVNAIGHESILLLEDYSRLREAASSALAGLGYLVTSVSSCNEAVEVTKELYARQGGVFDLVVLDLVLGETRDGVDAYQEILKIAPGQKGLIVSGFAATDRLATARRLGIGQILKKPFTMEELAQAVRAELDRAVISAARDKGTSEG